MSEQKIELKDCVVKIEKLDIEVPPTELAGHTFSEGEIPGDSYHNPEYPPDSDDGDLNLHRNSHVEKQHEQHEGDSTEKETSVPNPQEASQRSSGALKSGKFSTKRCAKDKEYKRTRRKRTSPEQYDIYLKSLEEDKIFRTGIAPMENPSYIREKWVELSKRLNNCENGPKLSANEWKMRFMWWKNNEIRHKKRPNGKLRTIVGLTAREKKASNLSWRHPVKKHKTNSHKLESMNKDFNKSTQEGSMNNLEGTVIKDKTLESEEYYMYKKSSIEQFEIFVNLLAEQKNATFSKQKWDECCDILNSCESGPKLSHYVWKTRFSAWKHYVKQKYLKSAYGKRKNIFLTAVEKKAIKLWWRYPDKQLEAHSFKEKPMTASLNKDIKQKSVKRRGKIKKNKKRTSSDQYDIYLQLLEEDKIFRTGIAPKENPVYIRKKWTELSSRLNNCESGPKLLPKEWKMRFYAWKANIRCKLRLNASRKNIVALTPRETKAFNLLWRNPGIQHRTYPFKERAAKNHNPEESDRANIAPIEHEHAETNDIAPMESEVTPDNVAKIACKEVDTNNRMPMESEEAAKQSEKVLPKTKAIEIANALSTSQMEDMRMLSKEIKRWADVKEEKLKFQIAKFKFRNPGFTYDYDPTSKPNPKN